MDTAAATEVAVAAAAEDTAAGTITLETADTAFRTIIPMGMPKGLCALAAPCLSCFFHPYRTFMLT